MSGVADFNTATNQFFTVPDTTGGLTFTGVNGYTAFSSIDDKAFQDEWKKFRIEFLPLLLKDSHWPIKNFTMSRSMDPTTKKTKVSIHIEYEPGQVPKKGVRKTL